MIAVEYDSKLQMLQYAAPAWTAGSVVVGLCCSATAAAYAPAVVCPRNIFVIECFADWYEHLLAETEPRLSQMPGRCLRCRPGGIQDYRY